MGSTTSSTLEPTRGEAERDRGSQHQGLKRGAEAPTGTARRVQAAVTALVVFGPLAGTVIAAISFFGHGLDLLDVILAVAFYALSGHGVTAGYHRLFAHRGYVARRWTKIVLCAAGSLAFQGSLLAWVTHHRRHHAYTDVEGDPHSPYGFGERRGSRLRGGLHAHIGWLFTAPAADANRWAPDLLADRDLVLLSRLFPLACAVSLAAPALLAWAITGTAAGALGGFVWGGLVRVFVLQQSTFAVNSACHLWGRRPFRTRARDRSTNFAPLAVLAMGENWHNAHHSNPRMARHGVDRGQLDSTARLIRLLEILHLVSAVRWPSPAELDAKRRQPS